MHVVSRFLFLFTGDETEITLLGDGSEKPEFEEWKWAAMGEVTQMVSNYTRKYMCIYMCVYVNVCNINLWLMAIQP